MSNDMPHHSADVSPLILSVVLCAQDKQLERFPSLQMGKSEVKVKKNKIT